MLRYLVFIGQEEERTQRLNSDTERTQYKMADINFNTIIITLNINGLNTLRLNIKPRLNKNKK